MDGGAWWATVHGVARSWTRLQMAGPQSCVCSSQGHLIDPPERQVHFVRTYILGHHISRQDSGILVLNYRLLPISPPIHFTKLN